jgi:uncharacterized membrane protein
MDKNWQHNADGLEDEKQREAQAAVMPLMLTAARIASSEHACAWNLTPLSAKLFFF